MIEVGFRKAILASFTALALTVGCGDDGPSTPTPVPPPTPPPIVQPPAVTLDALSMRGPSWFVDDMTLEVGDTVQLTLYAQYSDDTETDVTDEAVWYSSNDHVATIVNGLVTGRNAGGAEIRVRFDRLEARTPFRVEAPPTTTPVPSPNHPPVRYYSNCAAMRDAGWYNGVNRNGGTYRSSWDDAEKRTYGLNTARDRDKDGRACERS